LAHRNSPSIVYKNLGRFGVRRKRDFLTIDKTTMDSFGSGVLFPTPLGLGIGGLLGYGNGSSFPFLTPFFEPSLNRCTILGDGLGELVDGCTMFRGGSI
jgi:hypothetical protein